MQRGRKPLWWDLSSTPRQRCRGRSARPIGERPVYGASINGDYALVPAFWWFELRNALVVNERRGRIVEPQTVRFLRDMSRQPITIDGSPDETTF